MQRTKMAVLACSMVAIASVMLIASIVGDHGPVDVEPGGVEGLDVGTVVAVEGVLDSGGLRDLDGRASGILLGPDGTSVRLYLTFPPSGVGAGDRVRVVGTVALYQGSAEVVVGSPGDLRVIERNLRPVTTLDEVAQDPWGFEGLEPRVLVTVARSPVAMPSSGGWWAVVGDGSGAGTSTPLTAVVLPPDSDVKDWAQGASLDLVARVRYDAGRGLVYLEAVEWSPAT